MRALRLLHVFAALLLTGCTDIRGRLSPDVLAADIADQTRFAAHVSGGEAPVTATAASPDLLCDALRQASGKEISAGHLTLLAFSGDPGAVLPGWLSRRILAPTCGLLYLPANACAALEGGSLPTPDQLTAAVDTGALPCRTADTVTGDLWGGSGVTALHCLENGALTLMLWDGEALCGTVSQEACRGLALLGRRWSHFSADTGSGLCEVHRAALSVAAVQTGDTLHFTVRGQIVCSPADSAAEETLCRMLTAALTETAQSAGADIAALRESAIRSGISQAGHCTQAQWREILRHAAYDAAPELIGLP